LDYQTAGESHGPAVLAVVTGLPSGLEIDIGLVNAELKRRQGGYGRGGRQRIESDQAEFLSGLRLGRTIGSPVAMAVRNRDSRLDDADRTPPLHRPRPGHADLAGAIKHLVTDCRNTLERASARETAGRTAAGALARSLLKRFDIEVFGFVRSILDAGTDADVIEANWRKHRDRRDASETYCPDPSATAAQIEVIRKAKTDKDTVGGVIEAHVFGLPIGLGSCADWRDRLDARLAGAVMGIQAIKGVEIGLGMGTAGRVGSRVHDPIRYDADRSDRPHLGFVRDSNNAGGIEGGMTNGQPVVVRAAMKPISTLLRGLPSVNLETGQAEDSQYERSDVCAVPAASVVLENVVAFEIARALLDKFAGDSLSEVEANYDHYLIAARNLPDNPPTMTIA
jgi:chorismate synthase